jgi:RimJ/RimL family protein N-acetyltransferase
MGEQLADLGPQRGDTVGRADGRRHRGTGARIRSEPYGKITLRAAGASPSRIVAAVRLLITRDVDEFAAQTAAYLAARPERNMPATLVANIRSGHYEPDTALFAYALDEHADVVAIAMRTPPWPMMVFDTTDPDLAAELVAQWFALAPDTDAVGGEPAAVRAFCAAWERHTGGRAELRMSEAMHSLTQATDPPRPAPGGLRHATTTDRDLLIEWELAFIAEAGIGDGAGAERRVDNRLRARSAHIWEHDGTRVSALANSPIVFGIGRIGPVYTPPEHRNRGYASSAVAATSRQLLAAGAHTVMLYTDLANPTSNRIYASVGFVRFGSWEEFALAR